MARDNGDAEAREQDVELIVVKLPGAKKGFILLNPDVGGDAALLG